MALKITVIGTGYLGATHAAAMAELGFEVLGLDVVPGEDRDARSGARSPMYEPGLEELLRRHVAGHRGLHRAAALHHLLGGGRRVRRRPLRLREHPAEARRVRLRHVATSTPPSTRSPRICTRPALVVGKSTVPVGSADRLAARLAELAPGRRGRRAGLEPGVPARGLRRRRTRCTRTGSSSGVRSERAEKLLREVYATPIAEGSPFVVTDFPTAELVKTAANSFLATKISFINAMAEVCEAAGGDVAKLAEAIGHDDRIGSKFLRAGIGFGGGCLPKDIRAFMARAGELGADQALTFLREVDSINMRRRGQMVELAREARRRRPSSASGSRCSAPPSSPTPTTYATRPRSTSPGRSTSRAARSPSTTPRAWTTPARLFPTLGYARHGAGGGAGRRRRAAPDRVARVPRAGPGGARRGRGGPA